MFQTPPTAGTVNIGYADRDVQTDPTQLTVDWYGFFDVEEMTPGGLIHHEYGIKDYVVSIGMYSWE